MPSLKNYSQNWNLVNLFLHRITCISVDMGRFHNIFSKFNKCWLVLHFFFTTPFRCVATWPFNFLSSCGVRVSSLSVIKSTLTYFGSSGWALKEWFWVLAEWNHAIPKAELDFFLKTCISINLLTDLSPQFYNGATSFRNSMGSS